MNLTLPAWAKSARKVLLIQPSSASAERVFSILNNTFAKQTIQLIRTLLGDVTDAAI